MYTFIRSVEQLVPYKPDGCCIRNADKGRDTAEGLSHENYFSKRPALRQVVLLGVINNMGMQMIRGVQVHGNSKKKLTPKDRRAAVEHEKWLKKIGVKGSGSHRTEIPDYSTGPSVTSDIVPAMGKAKDHPKYTGNEIAGIVVTHKSNLMPIRKDNMKAAVDAAQMRR